MKVHTDNLVIRAGGTLLAIGWAGVGAFSIRASGSAPSGELADRAIWMGVTFLVAAAIAIPVSWLVRDLSNIWCVAPRRTPQERIAVTEESRHRRPEDGDA